MAKTKVLILGGGLSALSAGIHLLQEGGAERFAVTLLCMEHRLGGKASSWRLADGRYMETGFHAIFGYYTSLRTLLERAGHSTDDARWFTTNQGVHLMYEAGPRAVNRLDIPSGPLDVGALFHNGFTSYEGMSFTEKLAAAKWFATTGAKLLLEKIDPGIDEDSFTAYAISTGLARELTHKSWFRYVLDLAFNFPAEGSAYVGMYGFQRLIGPDNSTVYYLNGPLSEVIVRPITELFVSLGGKIEFCTKATRVELDPTTRRIERVSTRDMARPHLILGAPDFVEPAAIGGHYALADQGYPLGDPEPPPSAPERTLEFGRDFDEIVWTLPVDSSRALLRTAPAFDRAVLEQPELKNIWSLRTVASISLRIWLPEKVMPASYDTVVMGTPQPAGTIIDYTNRVSELGRGRHGSIIEFEGQEGLHAGFTDEEFVRELLSTFKKLSFVDANKVDVDAIMSQTNDHHFVFRRNAANHLRYLLMEPGHWKYRPVQGELFYTNLVFAGDWMRGTQPTASMEAAVRTGQVAANWLRDKVGIARTSA